MDHADGVQAVTHFPVIPASALSAMLDDMHREFLKHVAAALPIANRRRAAEHKPIISRTLAEEVLATVQGGDPVETLVRVQIDPDGSVTV